MAACFGPAKSRRSSIGRVFTSNLLLYVCSSIDYNLFSHYTYSFARGNLLLLKGGGPARSKVRHASIFYLIVFAFLMCVHSCLSQLIKSMYNHY
jgi:hypothetical protein